MAVKIRLRRIGKRNAGSYRVVVADERKAREGRFIETVGKYDPRLGREQLDMDRVHYWLGQGAQPTRTVKHLVERVRQHGASEGMSETEASRQAEGDQAVAAQPEQAASESEEAVEQ